MQFDHPHLKTIVNKTKALYTPVTLVFILYFSWSNRELLSKMFSVVDPVKIIVAIALWLLLHLLAPFSPKLIFKSMGLRFRYFDLLNIHISRLPARYLPGGIWHTVGRLSDYHSSGITKRQLAIFALIETLFPCVITLLIGGGYLWIAGKHTTHVISNAAGTLACISFLITTCLPYLLKNKCYSLLDSTFLFNYILLVMTSITFWIIASISFIFYYSSVSIDTSRMLWLDIAATYIFSWAIGYISIFAPQGIGVFEVVAGKLLELPITLGGAVAFLAGFRLVALAADGLAWSLFKSAQIIFQKTTSNNNDRPAPHSFNPS